jgi:Leucine-rich repeat (LRR) protein
MYATSVLILEMDVRKKINKSEGEIYNTDLLGITGLFLNIGENTKKVDNSGRLYTEGYVLDNLDDLSLFPDLVSLYIYRFNIDADAIDSLAKLQNMKILGLYGCQISGISDIGRLTNIEELDISDIYRRYKCDK